MSPQVAVAYVRLYPNGARSRKLMFSELLGYSSLSAIGCQWMSP